MINKFVGTVIVGLMLSPLFTISWAQAIQQQKTTYAQFQSSSNFVFFFDGVDDYLESSSLAISPQTGFGFSIWARPTKYGALGNLRTSPTSAAAGLPDNQIGLRLVGSSPQISTYVNGSPVINSSLAAIGINPFDGKFHNFIFTCDASSCAAYVDGKLAHVSPVSTIKLRLDVLRLGAANQMPGFFGGLQDSVSVWKAPITASQAQYIFNNRNSFTRFETGFHSWWNFDDADSRNLINDKFQLTLWGGVKRQLN